MILQNCRFNYIWRTLDSGFITDIMVILSHIGWFGWFMGVYRHFQQYFCYIWWRKPEFPEKTTDLRQVTDKLYHIMLNLVNIAINGVRIGTDCTGSCKSIYNTMKTTTFPKIKNFLSIKWKTNNTTLSEQFKNQIE